MNREKIKPSFNEKRVKLGEILPLDTPFTIMADISDVCNFKCNYCFRGMKENKSPYYGKNILMNWQTFEQIVKSTKEFDGRVKRFSLSHNGEPLAHPKFVEMVKYAKQENVADSVEIHTNASLLNEQLSYDIALSKIDRIVISIQGLNKEKYKEVCGVNINYKQFYNNIKILYDNKENTKIYIKIINEALEKGEEEEFYDLFQTIGDRVFVEKVVPLWNVTDKNNNLKEKITSNKFGENHKFQKNCPLMFYTINILPDGTIFPCTNLLPPIILGNVNEISLKKCWNSSKRIEFMRDQLKSTRLNNSICKNCYIPQNTILTENDSIDGYENEILQRIR